MKEIIKIAQLKKEYTMGKIKVPALNGINFNINKGCWCKKCSPSHWFATSSVFLLLWN